MLVEKAFARNAAEARQVVLAAEARGLLVMEAMWSRFLPHYDVVRHVVESGLIGDVVAVFADHGQRLYPDGPARLAQPELAGGALLDLGVYPVAFADLVLGAPEQVTATGTLTDLGVDATTTITVTGPGGAHGVLSCTMAAVTPGTAVVAGTEARLELSGAFYGAGSGIRLVAGPTRWSTSTPAACRRTCAASPTRQPSSRAASSPASASRRSCRMPRRCGSWRRWTRCVARSA